MGERELDIGRTQDNFKAFSVKLWWKVRTRKSLWAEFILAKYCNPMLPAIYPTRPYHLAFEKRFIRIREATQSDIF